MRHITKLQHMAREAGVPEERMFAPDFNFLSEKALVRAIQEARGQTPCFRRNGCEHCTNRECEWHDRCVRLLAHWQR